MKRNAKITAVILIMTLVLSVGIAGCGEKNDPVVSVSAKESEITLFSSQVMGYDYSALFEIENGDESVPVLSSYIDRSKLSSEVGEYTVTCTYGGKSASVTIKVVADEEPKPPEPVHEYSLSLSVESVKINADEVAGYDFKALFTAKTDGKTVTIPDSAVETDVESKAGEYEYTVRHGDLSETLKIIVWETRKVEIVAAYRLKEIPLNEAADFDFTSLFSLYLKGKAAKVELSMLENGMGETVSEGDSFTVKASYTDGEGGSDEKSVSVKIVAAKQTAVSVKNITTYPNAESIDLTELFEISYGDEEIPVTADMISGVVDYSKAGDNDIVLSYEGKTYTAVVSVVHGVVIEYAKADTLTVIAGTDKRTYSFASDFVVTINGTRYTNIEEYIDVSEVDFSKAGTYTATAEIPYNTQNIPLGGEVPFDGTVSAHITYVVTDIAAQVKVYSDFVELPSDTSEYGIADIRGNVSVSVNGTPCTLTDRRDFVTDRYTVFVDVISGVDCEDKGEQTVEADLYVYGPDKDPERISYKVIIGSAIKVSARDAVVFIGGTLYSRDLFTVTVGGDEIEVTDDMIEGKADTFEPGIYYITVDYEGVRATSKVVVYEKYLKGVYKTLLAPIPETSNDDYEDTGWGEEYSLRSSLPGLFDDTVGDMVIDDDGITVNGVVAKDVCGIDEHTMSLVLSGNKYMLYYDDGIVVLDPLNEYKLGFTNLRRPLVYFADDLWDLDYAITINYGEKHILESTFTGYSIDTFRISSKDGSRSMWYGLKVELAAKTSADTMYRVNWGPVEYAADFEPGDMNKSSSFVFGGDMYKFTMQNRVVGKINKVTDEKLYAGMRFTGKVDGKDAYLVADSSERFTYVVDNEVLVGSVGGSDTANYMVLGGANYADGIVRLNSYGDKYRPEVYSYQFKVDPTRNRFSLNKRDLYYGRYETQKGDMFIFLDGYGNGCMSFNAEGSSKTLLTYTVSGNEIELRFTGTLPTFEYGEKMTLYIAPLLNVLTVKRATKLDAGIVFTNRADVMVDGAIVEMSDLTVGAGSDAVVKPLLLNSIKVVDKDGEWDYAKKNDLNNINTMRIEFTKAGFYQFTVTVSVDGLKVVNYYSIQVIEEKYADNALITAYGAGTMFTQNSLTMDSYGRATVVVGGTSFKGSVTQADETSFTVKAFSDTGAYIAGTGTLLAGGLISFRAVGAAPFADFFTLGTQRAIGKTGAGIEGIVLREFTVGGIKTYFAASSATSMGEKVEVEIIQGSEQLEPNTTLKIKWSNGTERQVTIGTWGDTTDGLQVV